ncbi:hypothetical protein C9374_000436 [Naegleria lovaniensis]|uniref:N-acetyltransferase domain-containing protein n=1 Tax=Naegleria lovaniensis TaxID=51637 RepID=A0AA88KSU8_NAELO|nr:uncharacterized protein C9374_000436 [Naegleria lovaniensis]KAG2388272.1 hypothetical protein C9374_000436 [Naegleria lovaniensis]
MGFFSDVFNTTTTYGNDQPSTTLTSLPTTFKMYHPKIHYYFRRVDDEVVLCNLVSQQTNNQVNQLFTPLNNHTVGMIDENLQISDHCNDDVDTLFELTRRNLTFLHEFIPTITLAGNDKRSISNFIDTCNQRYNQFIPQHIMLTAAIWYRNEMAGLVAIQNFNPSNCNCEVGYWIGQEFQSKGIAIRAVRQFCRDLFQTSAPISTTSTTSMACNETHGPVINSYVHKIIFKVDAENTRSCKLCEKLQCTKEGYLREHEFYHNKFHDVVYYALLRSDIN